jgi:hypothetical protein
LNVTRIGAVAAGVAVMLAAVHPSQTADKPAEAPSPVQLAEAPEKIYSDNPDDSWNRIFYYLFSRRVTAHLTADFPEGAPFREVDGLLQALHLQMSTRTFERNETGDRAIDPLYPSFLVDDGIRVVLRNPAYERFRKALEGGLRDTAARSPMARGMMQNDLWSAYDIVFRYQHYEQQGQYELAQRRLEVLDLLGQMMRKVALTPEEIRGLPNNYSAAKTKRPLPDLFGKDSGWVEVQWFPQRMHDASADYRRVTRVFLKPARAPQDMQKFLNDFRGENNGPIGRLEGVALVIQPLVIDMRGELVATNVTTDVQFRMFEKTSEGAFQRTRIGVFEVSRKRLLSQQESGGMTEVEENEGMYLSAAGNDYTFASPHCGNGGPPTPLVVRPRTRCSFCHGGNDVTRVMTFGIAIPPKEGMGPPVRQLDRAKHKAAGFVMSKKMGREDWKSLGKHFQK